MSQRKLSEQELRKRENRFVVWQILRNEMITSKKLLQYFFLAFVFLLPLQTVFLLREPMINGVKWQYGVIALYATDILLVLSLIVFVWRLIRKQEKIEKDATLKIFLVLIAWAGLSVLWAADVWLVFYFFLKLCLSFGVFILARSLDGKAIKKIIIALIVAALLESSLGVWQFLAQKSFSSMLLGMSDYEAWRAGVSVLKNESGRWLRAYGTFPHPNILGGFLGAVLAMAASLFVLRENKKWILISVPIILLGLLVSFSRATWLGLVVGIGWLAGIIYQRNNFTERKNFWKMIFVFSAAGIIFTFILKDVIFPRFDSVIIGKENSVSERETTWREAVFLIRKHPFAGVGVGNYTVALIQKYPSIPVYAIQPAHNVFLLVGAELGLIGMIIFLGLVYKIVASIFSCDAKVCVSGVPFLAALLVLTPSLFIDHFLWSSHFGLLFFFLLAGLAMNRVENA